MNRHQSWKSQGSLLALMLISAGMLVFEISLTRFFAVQQFHHFAFLVVSLAVMGLAASGLLLALTSRRPSLTLVALGFSLSMLGAYFILNQLPFDSYSIAWDQQQVWILLVYFLAAALPFLFAGWVTGSSLEQAGAEARIPYAAVFIGAAIGCPLALAAHAASGSYLGIVLAAVLGALGASIYHRGAVGSLALASLAVGLIILGITRPSKFSPILSPYKPLSIVSLVPDAELDPTMWSASTRVDVVHSDAIHIFPGLSLNAGVNIPAQSGLFLDGDGPIPITAASPAQATTRSLAESMPSALAYELRPQANAFLARPGAGLNLIIALANGAARVTLPVDEPLVIEVLDRPIEDQTQSILDEPAVQIVERPTRGALRDETASYDIVEFALSQPFRQVNSGAFSLSEEYDFTVEAFQDAFQRLDEDGLLIVTRWLSTPPAESAKAWATILKALNMEGVENPEEHLIAYRSMRTATMIAARQPFEDWELDHTRQFLQTNGFDPIHLPDLEENERNRFNRLPESVYHQVFQALLTDLDATIDQASFNLTPPTDEQPYFFHFFRWRQTPEILAGFGLTWQPFGGSGYFVLLALLALMLLLAAPLLLTAWLPLGRTRSQPQRSVTLYFGFLGAGYLLIEIPLIQRLVLLLDQPAIALTTVLFTLLLSSGIGSLFSARLNLRRTLILLVLILLVALWLVPSSIDLALGWPLSARLGLSLLLLAIPGFLMGIPFATGIQRVEERGSGQIPWAWAINGAASGVAGVTAALIALDWGFNAVMALGIAAYVGALLTIPRSNPVNL